MKMRSGREIPSGNDVETSKEKVNVMCELFMHKVAFITGPEQYVEPESFNEAYNHEDPIQQAKWGEAIEKEFNDMESRNVWKRIDRSKMAKDRRCVKCKWVLKIKRKGCSEQDWLHVVIAKLLELTSTKTMPQL